MNIFNVSEYSNVSPQQTLSKKKQTPVKQTPSNLGNVGITSASQSPFKSQRSDRDKLIRHQLTKIDSYMDIQKLISEVKSQNCDSYTIRQLLSKLKNYCQELMQIESELAVRQTHKQGVSDFRPNKIEHAQIVQQQLDYQLLANAELNQKLELCQNQLAVITERFQVIEDNLNQRDVDLKGREGKTLQNEQRLREWESLLRKEAEEIQKKLYESTTVGQSLINKDINGSIGQIHILPDTNESKQSTDQKILVNMLDQKLQQIQEREMNVASQLQQLRVFTGHLDSREQIIQKSEQSLNEKQEQLFRAYDILTEKIYQFERDCDDLKLRKKQVLIIEQKVRSLLNNNS